MVSYILSKKLEQKLSLVFGKHITLESQNERQLLKRKRKETAGNNDNKNKESQNIPKKIIPAGIVEDIFADIGKYVPIGSLDDKELEECSSRKLEKERSQMDIEVPNNSSAKGIFQNLLPSFPATIKMGIPKTDNLAPNSSNSLLKSSSIIVDDMTSISTACLFDEDDDENEGGAQEEEEDEFEKVIQINSSRVTSSSASRSTSQIKTKTIQVDSKKKDENINRNKNSNDENNEENGDEDDDRNISSTDGDLMAPIRALLTAQRKKEKAAYERSELAASAGKAVVVVVVVVAGWWWWW